VLVRLDDSSGGPVVKAQPPLRVDAAGNTPITEALADAVGRMTAEEFPPMPGKACHWCEFTAICPTKDIGRQVVS
jgi:hypothetical protein